MKLHAGGQLTWYLPQKQSDLEIQLEAPTRLTEVIARIPIPAGEVVLVVLNGELADLNTVMVTDADRVELYPPIGGGAIY